MFLVEMTSEILWAELTLNLCDFRECNVPLMSPTRLITSAETSVGRLWAQEEGSEDALFGSLVG